MQCPSKGVQDTKLLYELLGCSTVCWQHINFIGKNVAIAFL